MSGRVPADHETVSTHRTELDSVGRTSRPRISFPDAVSVSAGDVIRLSLDGEAYHASVESSLSGALDVRGAFENARLAREAPVDENCLKSWVDSTDLAVGDAVLLDVVTPGFQYGLRPPGERVVYDVLDRPSDSLADIARDLDG